MGEKDEALMDYGDQVIEEVIRYDRITGEPEKQNVVRWQYKLHYDLPALGLKAGDMLDEDAVNDLIPYEKQLDLGGSRLVCTSHCLGIRAFDEAEPYIMPQEYAMPITLCTEQAEQLWHTLFPGVPGRLLLYYHISY
jgi:hypothetical protein